MLVLTRRSGESISIGEDIVVKVVDIQGNRVRLAIDAPRDVTIRRSEVPTRPELVPAGCSAEMSECLGMNI